MIPVLYSSTETEFANNGLGPLSDAISCQVIEERNGSYELEMDYPITGNHYKDIAKLGIVMAKPADGKDSQPFAIYKVSRPIGGNVTVYARHISCRLSMIPVKPFSSTGISTTLNALIKNSVEDCPFTVYTDIVNTTSKYQQVEPLSFKQCLGGVDNSILDIFGGEYEWDKFAIKLHSARGSDLGISIDYGKNLTDVVQEENIESTVTGIYPYWIDSQTKETVLAPVQECSNAGSYPYKRTIPMNLSTYFQDKPTVEQLTELAALYVQNAGLGVPNVNLKISFVPLWQTEEYKNIAALERVSLCDIVSVRFDELGISSKAKVIKTTYNVLTERYESIELGNERGTFSDIVSTAIKDSKKDRATISDLKYALSQQKKIMNGEAGGYVITKYDANGHPSETIYGDTDDIATMVNCVRINKNGIAFSKNGYNGDFVTAWTIDGSFSADFITSGTLNANMIQVGSLGADVLSESAKTELTEGTTTAVGTLKTETENKFADLEKYVRIVDGKIVLGAQGSDIKLRIENNQISHLMGGDADGVVKSFWTNDSFDITGLNKFSLGAMSIVKQENNSISFVRR